MQWFDNGIIEPVGLSILALNWKSVARFSKSLSRNMKLLLVVALAILGTGTYQLTEFSH